MKIISIATIAGPNVYHYRPVIRVKLQLDELNRVESCEIPGFVDRLLDRLPGLQQHHCAAGGPGGFVRRLRSGTWFGHITEHVAIELSNLAGIGVNFGKTRESDVHGIFDVIVAYRAEKGMRFLLNVAVELVDALVADRPYPLEEKLAQVERLIADTELGPSTRAIVGAAERRGIPWCRIGDGSLVQLGHGRNRRRIQAALTSMTSGVGIDVAGDKQLTKMILDRAQIPVPYGREVVSPEEALAFQREIGGPIVIKPLDGCQGKGITLDPSPEEIGEAFERAAQDGQRVIAEELVRGRNYRILVVDGRLIAAAERNAPQVTGDGHSTIADLVEQENRNPLRGYDHEKPLSRIRLDAAAIAFLARTNRTVDDVPAEGEVVVVRDCMNISTGGTARDVTDDVHAATRDACERAARGIGLDICGIDIVTDDISRPLRDGRGAFIEINAAPGLRMHLQPSQGTPRDVGGAIIEMLFPPGSPSRIPIVSITGTNGKTTVTRLISHAMASTGKHVGTTTTDGIYLDGRMIAEGDMTGPASATTILDDPSVEVAVLETARGGIVRRGLGYDWSDVGVLTNIQADHYGQDGIRDADDLFHIKSLVAERVKAGGTVVINADDSLLVRLPSHRRMRGTERTYVFFAMSEQNEVLRNHRAHGGRGIFVREGMIIEADGDHETEVVRVADVPVTLGGTAAYQVANVLAAIAACRALGLETRQIASALRSFRGSAHNPGRLSLFSTPEGARVVIDYGHNPAALQSVVDLVSTWDAPRRTAILGAPGDRPNTLINDLGRIAAHGFDRIILVEDHDRRGRVAGEVSSVLCQSIKDEVPHREVVIILDQVQALESELRRLRAGEVLVMFYEKFAAVRDVLERHGATVVDETEMPPAIRHEGDRQAASRDERRPFAIARRA